MSDSTNDTYWFDRNVNYIPDHEEPIQLDPDTLEGVDFVKFDILYNSTGCGNANRVLEYLDALSREDKDNTKSEDE